MAKANEEPAIIQQSCTDGVSLSSFSSFFIIGMAIWSAYTDSKMPDISNIKEMRGLNKAMMLRNGLTEQKRLDAMSFQLHLLFIFYIVSWKV